MAVARASTVHQTRMNTITIAQVMNYDFDDLVLSLSLRLFNCFPGANSLVSHVFTAVD